MPCVTLSKEELTDASKVAADLHDRLRKRGVKDAHGARRGDISREDEAGGAAAELAVARLLGVEWTAGQPGHDTYGPDVGTRTQVRSSNKPRPSHHLIVRSRDIEKYHDVPFVLVIQTGTQFDVKGWCMAYEALEIGRLWDGGNSQRPDAWFVHESKLHPIETLENP